ncbi:hypothetical protein D3C84_868320 [compost metagenome]
MRVKRPGSPGPAPTSTTSPISVWALSSPSFSHCSAPCQSAFSIRPARVLEAKARSQKRRRSEREASTRLARLRTRPESSASPPRWRGSRLSSRSRNRRTSTGALPPLETATMMGLRSMMEGKIKLERSGSSTTFTKSPS